MVMPTVAAVTTGVVTVAECGLVASVGLATVAVFVMVAPLAVLALTWTTTVKVAEAPAARVASVPVMVPVLPAAGLVKLKVGPLVWLSDTKVVLAVSMYVGCTVWASDGPLLAPVMV